MIVYGPKLKPFVVKGLRKEGVKVFTNTKELIDYLRSKGVK